MTQLCTFAYVVVWPEILYEVEYELEAEELRTLQEEASKKEKEKQKRAEREQQQNAEQNYDREKERDNKDEKPQRHHQEEQAQQREWEPENDSRDRRYFHHRPISPAGSSSTIRAGNISLSASTATLDLQSISTAGVATEGLGPATSSSSLLPHLLSPSPAADPSLSDSRFHAYQRNTPLYSEPPSASTSPSTVAQTQGERFALAARLSRIADKEAQAAYERSAAFARKPQPVPTPHPSLNTSAHLAHLSPYVIVDPRRATGKDSLYLSAIGRRFSDPKVRAAWPVFWKYFNGRAALERVILGLGGDGAGEGVGSDKMKIKKRKEAWTLMTAMSEHLICIRHF